jgi:hypothetical protein
VCTSFYAKVVPEGHIIMTTDMVFFFGILVFYNLVQVPSYQLGIIVNMKNPLHVRSKLFLLNLVTAMT